MSTATIESRSPQDQSDVVVERAGRRPRGRSPPRSQRARAAQREWARSALARADALSAAAEARQRRQGRDRRPDGPRGRQAAHRGRAASTAAPCASCATRRRRRSTPTATPTRRAAVGPAHAADEPPPPARRRRADHAVELPVRDPAVEGRARARLRQRGRAQARVGRDRLRAAAGRSSSARHCPRACSTSSPGRARPARRVIELADVVSFTGSTAVGLAVARGGRGARHPGAVRDGRAERRRSCCPTPTSSRPPR